MAFHIDGAERTRRTKVLACSASYAAFGIDCRYLDGGLIFRIRRNHLYGAGRAMAGTISTFHLVGDADAVLFNPYGMADLDGRFFGKACQMDGTGGAYLCTLCTFGAAVTTLIGHFRLHQFHQVRRRPEHLIGTYRYTELAGCAVLCKVPGAQ